MAERSLANSALSSERTSVRARTAEVYTIHLLANHTSRCVDIRWGLTYLLVNNSSKTSLTLNNSVRDTHLAAKSGQENNQLNGVNVVSNQDKGSLLVLDEADNVVKTVLDVVGLLGDILLLLALSDGGGLGVETLLLLDLGLGTVLVEELEGLGSGVAVQGVLELSNGRRDLETEVQDLLLALQTDILGPLDETAEVALGLDVLANAEVAGALLDERVLLYLLVLLMVVSID